MKAIVKTQKENRVISLKHIKSISSVSQCNLLITKQTGEQITAISVEFQ